MDLLRYLPLAYISWFLGMLANMPLPQPLARWTILVFARAYSIDVSLASRPLDTYRCIGEFFTRDLREGLRPISEVQVVSPVDGTLRAFQNVESPGSITQVKGKDYTVSALLAADELSEKFENGQLWNFYLSPSDAHHIHAPVDGRIVKTVHIPGRLWPVNDWALHSIDGLFAVNERVVTYIETSDGLIAVVMVGATNVGRISVAYTPLETNCQPWKAKGLDVRVHEPAIPVVKGQKLGTFKMGSSVIVVSEGRHFTPVMSAEPRPVVRGEALVRGEVK
jgi:phosphatidylserine decarboxylase